MHAAIVIGPSKKTYFFFNSGLMTFVLFFNSGKKKTPNKFTLLTIFKPTL